jgi:glucokinase
MTDEPKMAIGVDLGGTAIKAALVRENGEIVAQDTGPTEAQSGEHEVAGRISDLVDRILSANQLTKEAISGIGIGVPGVTTAEGVVIIAPNLYWHHVPFRQILQDRVNVRVEIDNDANVAALAETRAGVGAGCDTLFFMTLGTGIGGGLIVNGKIHHGASHSAGEIGHMCVLPEGPTCACGKPGCLETLAAGPAMARYVRVALSEGRSCALQDPLEITPEAICRSAEAGDEVCRESVKRSAHYLGIAAANIINVISPDVIAIGGGISAAGETILDPIVESARNYSLEGMFEHTRIVLATLGNNAGSLGAAFLVL